MPARRRSGEEIRIELTLSELLGASGERYAVAAMRDASRRTQLELTMLELAQARVARSEAEAELAMRDELLATIEAALRGNPSAENVQRLVRVLTDVQHVHRGELRIATIETDLVDMAHAAVDEIRTRTPERRIVIDTPPRAAVVCDPRHMGEVLLQVLDEATRRTSAHARIELRIERLSSQLVQLTVRSQGCGDTSAAGPGLHLGRSLVRRQGGTFTTAISPDGSLEVVLTLPASTHPSRPQQFSVPAARRARRPRS
jgi:K+-sensing histidine kinase KdpD